MTRPLLVRAMAELVSLVGHVNAAASELELGVGEGVGVGVAFDPVLGTDLLP